MSDDRAFIERIGGAGTPANPCRRGPAITRNEFRGRRGYCHSMALDPTAREEIAADSPALARAVQDDGSVKFDDRTERDRAFAEARAVKEQCAAEKAVETEAARKQELRDFEASPFGKAADAFLDANKPVKVTTTGDSDA